MEHKPIAVPIRTGFGMLGVGVTKGYELVSEGELETFKIGTATRVTVASIEAYVARQLARHREAA